MLRGPGLDVPCAHEMRSRKVGMLDRRVQHGSLVWLAAGLRIGDHVILQMGCALAAERCQTVLGTVWQRSAVGGPRKYAWIRQTAQQAAERALWLASGAWRERVMHDNSNRLLKCSCELKS